MAKNLNFNVGDGLTLTLQDLWANVEIHIGQGGKATVVLGGDDKLLEQIEVTQPSADQLLVKGSGEGGDGITVIQSGGHGSISVGNIRGSCVVIGGSIVGRTVVPGGDLVVINGKVISGGDKVTVVEGGETPKIVVTVPHGTDLEAYDVSSVDSHGLGGKLDISLSSQGEATIDTANDMKVRCSGQSHVHIIDAAGDLKASCSGQSSVTINGSCKDCYADASGMSRVTVSGRATGKVRKHQSGMSHISVG